MTLGKALLGVLAFYVAAGLATGAAFVAVGVERVMPASYTVGARLLLLPASAALWPYVLIRWLKTRRAPRNAR